MATVVEGTVIREGRPVEGAYVRLIGPSGEYVSERRTLDNGAFRFNVGPGKWTLQWQIPGKPVERKQIDLSEGQVAQETITIA